MPGLLNRSTWAPLPLNSSSIKACTNGYSLRITTSLTYTNPESEPVEGVFVYLLEESEVVVAFEALTAGRLVTIQVKSRARADDCCFDCYNRANQALQCNNGHLILDEDMDRTTFIVSTGLIGSRDTMTIFLSTTLELQTQPNGTVQVSFPSAFMPRVCSHEGKLESTRRDEEGFRPTNCFGAGGTRVEKMNDHHNLPEILTEQVFNPVPYEFSFEMLVRGPCLLAGVESPTHALRAGADPIARSASTLYITLAEKHHYDRDLQIILHPSEPYVPHILLEKGSMSFEGYERHVKNRRDFIRLMRKSSNADKRVDFVRKRFHKDIRFNPVLMLNFCPDLHSSPTDFGNVTREIIFLVDRSRSTSGINMEKIKEAMLVAIKSLPPGTLLNIIGLGTNVRTLFSSSQVCSDETLSLANEYIQRMGADMGSSNILGALSWIYKQPVHCGYPRQLFILTDASMSQAGKIIELVRKNASSARCFSYGLGPNACKRLLRRVAKITGGLFESFSEGEQLQPKLIKSLKKAIEPVMSDITIEWYLPDTLEVLLSPMEIGPLYPGDHLNSYGVIYDLSGFQRKKNVGKQHISKTVLKESANSVFQNQGESSTSALSDRSNLSFPAEKNDIKDALKEISQEISTEFSAVNVEESEKSKDAESDSFNDLRKRISLTSYIHEQYTLTHCSLSNLKGPRDRSLSTCGSNSSDSTEPPDIGREVASFPHGLENIAHQGQKGLVRWESSKKTLSNVESTNGKGFPGADPVSDEARRKRKLIAQAALSGRSFSSPNGQLDMHYLRKALAKVSTAKSYNWSVGGRMNDIGQESQQFQADSSSRKSLNDSNALLFQAATPEWDTFFDPENLFLPMTLDESSLTEVNGAPVMQCKAVIHGLISGKSVTWEATANLSSLYHAAVQQEPTGTTKTPCDGILHQLTVHSVIRDFENMADKTNEIEYAPAGRYRLKAIQTSRASNSMSIYTTIVPVNAATQEPLPSYVEVRNTGVINQSRSSHSGSKRQRSYSTALGQRPSSHDYEELDDMFGSTGKDELPATPTSVGSSSSSGWERQSVPDDDLEQEAVHKDWWWDSSTTQSEGPITKTIDWETEAHGGDTAPGLCRSVLSCGEKSDALGERSDVSTLQDSTPPSALTMPPQPGTGPVTDTSEEVNEFKRETQSNVQSPSAISVRTQKSFENFFASRLSLGRYRSSSQTGKYIPIKPNSLSAKPDILPAEDIHDYMPLVRLQLASGAFLLNEAFSEAVQIPFDRLRRASPFSCHRASLSPSSRCAMTSKTESPLRGKISIHGEGVVQPCADRNDQCLLENNQENAEENIKGSKKITWSHLEGVVDHSSSLASRCNSFSASADGQSTVVQLVDSGRGSESDLCENSPVTSESSGASYRLINDLNSQYDDLEGMSWATAVGLGWLEHQSAGYFPEWELIAAKADTWLHSQQLPEQMNINGLKAATRQLFLLLRHWNENIKLNMLCYNPNNM
ncbi:von Willebrand factor A domain-containing protein 5B1 isoform X2 [Leucoraja erinacea]|uniref:von Willebrand factor A domain-containing protein 5B1 isoform X2 n=1 Tax=Leucoraja erinaceus TaxID=7782 RepID=UPI00245719E0|nr:von Willebrand factor A domain-containing protein 5B1 isoform X2 [Leucoraja erinacea]